ncbi:MAG: TIGR01244 family sulfur transferase [Pseudomonadales bacterium]|jgi:sulfide:quinone oxidoreductase|nr:TIGR01244 family sulfur transferase [Pseudomonadales bacterium]
MEPRWIDDALAIAEQLSADDFPRLAELGVRELLCLRPDDEEGDYLTSAEARRLAEAHGMRFVHVPVKGTDVTAEALDAIEGAIAGADEKSLAYCRSGRRVAVAWAMVQVHGGRPTSDVLASAAGHGFDLTELEAMLSRESVTARRTSIDARSAVPDEPVEARVFDVVVIGGGSAGLGTIASLRKRARGLSIALVEPSEEHHYQPGLTLVGNGWFDPKRITRPEADLIPKDVTWYRSGAKRFDPGSDLVELDSGERLRYRSLVVATGLILDWAGIAGAREALGTNGICCNYSPAHAPYTWERVQAMTGGRALFTQPPMPIKCAGAPQKAMYLACDRWLDKGVLKDVDVQFHNAGGVLFGVQHFVPTLMEYVERYGAHLHFGSTLKAIDAGDRVAYFEQADGEGVTKTEAVRFDFLHFVPPQKAPAVIAASPLADAAGWLEVDPHTLRHPRFGNVFGAGDVVGTSNAKTMAAARKHAPVVAENLLAQLDGREPVMGYDGYGACPLTVEGGKVVLAEFGYGGALLPTFPIAPEVPRYTQWVLKRHLMPYIYWDMMLKGREWFAEPRPLGTLQPQTA